MAKSGGIFRINGDIDGLCFYMLNGKPVVRRVGAVSDARRRNDPRFDMYRKNMSEFGAASHISKLLRMSFAPFAGKWSDSVISGRTTKLIKSIISMGSGKLGKRPFNAFLYGRFLSDFEFNSHYSMSSVWASFSGELSYDSSLYKIMFENLSFCPERDCNVPISASHVRIYLAVSFLNNYIFSDDSRLYVSDGVGSNFSSNSVCDWIDLHSSVGLSLSVNTIDFSAFSGKGAIVCAVGIEFGIENNNVIAPLVEKRCMRIVKVFPCV